VLQGICAVLSALTSAAAAATCAVLVTLGLVAALLAGLATVAMLLGGSVGTGTFVAAFCVSCGAGMLALSSVGGARWAELGWARLAC